MTHVQSSAIDDVAHDAETLALDVTFTSGRRYRYAAVPAATYAALLAAESKGAFFNEAIRDRFAFVEITDRKSNARRPAAPRSTARRARAPRSRA